MSPIVLVREESGSSLSTSTSKRQESTSFAKLDDHAQRGLVEYVSQYSSTGNIPALSEYVSEISRQTPDSYPIYIMASGRKDNEYQAQLAQLNWKEFYSSEKRGFLFVENLKAAIEAEYKPDYLLVDSRTGLTDISGICTLQLPDLVVLLFGLNQQNVQGISRIYKSIAHNKLNRRIKTLLVASPVPELAAYSEVKASRLQAAKEQIGGEIELSIPFDPSIAFEEAVVLKDENSALGKAYDALTERIIGTNDFDLLTVVKAAKTLQSAGDIEAAEVKFQEIVGTFAVNPDAWEAYANFLRSTRKLPAAIDALKTALQLGGRAMLHGALASAYLVNGDNVLAEKSFKEYLERADGGIELCMFADLFANRGEADVAIAGFRRALELDDPDRPLAPYVMHALGNLYLSKREPEQLPYIKNALDSDPTALAPNYNYGFCLTLLGRNTEATIFFEKAAAIFRET